MTQKINTIIHNYEYVKVHKWIKKQLGAASYCANDRSHKGKRFEWANISGEYKFDINDFKPLCPSCHRKMDFTDSQREKLRKINMGNTNRARKVYQFGLDGRLIKEWDMIKDANEALGLSTTAICNVLAGRATTAGGWIWKK
jgi:hypothetical protein